MVEQLLLVQAGLITTEGIIVEEKPREEWDYYAGKREVSVYFRLNKQCDYITLTKRIKTRSIRQKNQNVQLF